MRKISVIEKPEQMFCFKFDIVGTQIVQIIAINTKKITVNVSNQMRSHRKSIENPKNNLVNHAIYHIMQSSEVNTYATNTVINSFQVSKL